MKDFPEGICGVCGQNRGQCKEARDAGNFVIPVWRTDEGASHEISEDSPLIGQVLIKPILVGYRIINEKTTIESDGE